MTTSPGTPAVPARTAAPVPEQAPDRAALHRRLTELRGGPEVPPRPLDARAIAALAANPGCRRRALLDGAGVDKSALAEALGAPAAFGQSQFAFVRGNAFEARVKGDGGTELIRLLCARTGEAAPAEVGEVWVPDLAAPGPAGRAARTRLALVEATAAGRWALFDHPMLTLDVAGSPVYLEPDAVAVHPDGSWTVVEIKSFPVLDGSADPAKVGAAARQAAVYSLALARMRVPRTTDADGGTAAADTAPEETPEEAPATEGSEAAPVVRTQALLVCPKDFSNLPTAALVDLRKQVASTRRQLARLARLDEIAAEVPDGTSFAPALPTEQLTDAVASVPAQYAPECLAGCELAFHCRDAARKAGEVTALGRSVRGELGGLTTVEAVLGAASSSDDGTEGTDGTDGTDSADAEGDAEGDAPGDSAASALRRASALRAEALASAGGDAEGALRPEHQGGRDSG